MIKTKGRNCHIFKRDLRRAYRQIPIDPGDINLVGFHWINHRFVDRVLSMGLRSSAHRREYLHVVFPSHVLNQNININQLELLVVMVCVKLWNTHLFKKKILIKCDNQSVVIVLNSGSTRDLFMQTCLREILFFCWKISPGILKETYKHLEIEKSLDKVCWCLFLIAFFTMSRKSNLVPISISKFDSKKLLTRGDILLENDILIVLIKWSKTIQFGQHILSIFFLINIPDNILCPVKAL